MLVALALAGLLAAVTVRLGVYSANHADAAGYVAAGHLWAAGRLARPDPAQLWATWPQARDTGSPLGFRPGRVTGTEVPIYPLGFPVLLGAAERLVGPLGAYLVAPLGAGALAFAAFLLGRALAGPLAGFLALALVAVNPVVLLHAVHPMSDVPAAAGWAIAWVLALRGGASAALAAGLATSMAIMVRPNLAPLALVPAMTLLAARDRASRAWTPLVVFVAASAIGPVVVAWSQTVLYGGPFASGYPGASAFFRAEHLAENLRNYPRSFLEVYTALPLLGLLTTPWAFARGLAPGSSVVAPWVVRGALLLMVLNAAAYAFYLPYADWSFLRFFLPATTALAVLAGGVLARTAQRTASRPWLRRLVLAVSVGLVATAVSHRPDLLRYAVNDWKDQARIPAMGAYLREALPANATVLCFLHSGSIAHYTGRDVVRLDLVAPETLDAIVDELTKRRTAVAFLLDHELDEPPFKERFASSRFGALDWSPRAEFITIGTIRYFLASDRERFVGGERWPTDVVRPDIVVR